MIMGLVVLSGNLNAQATDSFDINGRITNHYKPDNYYNWVFDTLNIGDGNPSNYVFLFRLLHEGRIIELKSKDGSTFQLIAYFYAWEYTGKLSHQEILFIDSVIFNDKLALQFYERYFKTMSESVWLTDSSGFGYFDGTAYEVSIKDSNMCYYRLYRRNFEGIDTSNLEPYQVAIMDFFTTLQLTPKYHDFIHKLGPGQYGNGGYGIMTSMPVRKKKRLFLR